MNHTPPTSDTARPAARVLPGLEGEECSRIVGFDIGGTKCAVCRVRENAVEEIVRIETRDFATTFAALADAAECIMPENPIIGVSCGGPLDASRGIILSPPNLDPSWHGVEIARLITERFGGRATLMNDANACALAEWRFGAGRGCQSMVFLTSGTGMGAGLILNGKLYEGTRGDAGEVGHIRLAPDGPVGFGKAGSFEGFCSGGGIARLAVMMALRQSQSPQWIGAAGTTTARFVADAARNGDALAIEVMSEAGRRLGEALAVLIDVLNPERIVIGGHFPKTHDLLESAMREALASEALPHSLEACQIVPAELGESIGSHGAVAVALNAFLDA
ncbi:MAG TPA: ROK family protein [Opitutaceae bacterium]|nr:ROK family protein [Opitutaceae bacterium]